MAKTQNENDQAIQGEINALKQLLSNTDYKAIKYSEGLIPEKDYVEIREQREAWRARINELEEEQQRFGAI